MYRYTIRGAGFQFDHQERSGRKLHPGSIVRARQGPDEFRITRIVKEPLPVLGSVLPLRAAAGIADAERFVRRN